MNLHGLASSIDIGNDWQLIDSDNNTKKITSTKKHLKRITNRHGFILSVVGKSFNAYLLWL